jgi:hypothetical protein
MTGEAASRSKWCDKCCGLHPPIEEGGACLYAMMWATHDFTTGQELPICSKCNKSPIALGFWGDCDYKRKQIDWMTPCGEPNWKDAHEEWVKSLRRNKRKLTPVHFPVSGTMPNHVDCPICGTICYKEK